MWSKRGLIRALPFILGLSFLTFPMVSSLAFQAFDCEDFDDGSSFLRADYSVACNDADEYGRVRTLAWIAIALYPLAIPIGCQALLLSTRKAILSENPTPLSSSLAFLHEDYEPSFYWWELVETTKKARHPPLLCLGHCHRPPECPPLPLRSFSLSASVYSFRPPGPWSNSSMASSSHWSCF